MRLFAAAILLLVAVLTVPSLINLDSYAHLLADALTEALGSRVAIKSGRLAILPDVSFVVSSVEIPDGVGPIEKLSVPRARIDLDVVSLLFGKLLVEEVHIRNPQVWLVRDRKSEDLSAPRPPVASGGESPLSFLRASDMLPERLDVSISGGHITLLDRVVASPATVETWFCDTDIEVRGMSSDAPFDVSASCNLPCGGDAGEIEAEFEIDPSVLSSRDGLLPFRLKGNVSAEQIPLPLFTAYLPSKVRDAGFSGHCGIEVSIETQDSRRIAFDGQAEIKQLSLRNSLAGQNAGGAHDLSMTFQILADRTDFIAQPIHMTIDTNKLSGKLVIVRFGAPDPGVAFEVGCYEMPLATALDLFPAPLMPEDAREKINSMSISGELRRLMVEFMGKASDLSDDSSLAPKSLAAHFSIRNATVSPFYETLDLRKLSGSVSLQDGIVSARIREGLIASPNADQPVCSIESISTHWGFLGDLTEKAYGQPWMSPGEDRDPSRKDEPMVVARLKATSSFSGIPVICASVPSLSAAAPFFRNVDKLEGELIGSGNLTAFLAEAYDAQFDVRLTFWRGRLRYIPSDLELRIPYIVAHIEPRSAKIRIKQPARGKPPIDATITIENPFSASEQMSVEGVIRAKPESLQALLDLSDPGYPMACTGPTIEIKMSAKGKLDELKLAINAGLTENEISYGEWFRKLPGQTCNLSVSATTTGLEEVSIDEAQLKIGGVTVRGSGKFVKTDAPRWELSAYLNETNVSELARFCPMVAHIDTKAKLSGWLRLLPIAKTVGQKTAGGSALTSSSCEAGLVATLDADAINKVLGAEVMPESIRRAAEQMDFASGQVSVEATTSFPLENVQDARFKVAAELQDLDVKHQDVPLELSGLSGNVEVTEEALHIRSMSGVLGKSGFELEGSVNEPLLAALEKDRWKTTDVNVHLSVRPSLSDLRTFFGASFFEELSYSQAPEIELKAKGAPDDLTIDARVSPQGDRLSWGDICLDPDRADLNFSLTGRLQELSRLSALRGEVMVGASRLKFTGEAADLTEPEFSLRIAKSPVRMADISALLPMLDPSLARGELVLSMDGKSGPQAPTGRRFEAQLQARDVSFGLSGSERHFENLNFACKASPNVINVDGFGVRVGQSTVSLDARADFDADVLRLNLRSPQLNTADFVTGFSPKEPSALRSATETSVTAAASATDLTWLEELPFFARGTVDASVSVDRFKAGEHDFGRIELTLPVRDGVLRIDGFQTDFCQGNLNLNLVSRILMECGLSVETDFKMKDVRLEEVLALLGTKKVLATGRASVSGGFQVCGSDTDELLNFAEGQLTLKSRDGVIKKLGILSKIFSLLDILRIFKMDFRDFATTGTSYELLKCTATLGDGVLSTRDFVLVGSSMKMTAICDIDLLNQSIESTIGVFLLPTMGSITHKIPFVGPMITQGNKTLLPTYFRVYGNLSDPKVESLNLDRIKDSTIEALRKLLGGGDSARPSSGIRQTQSAAKTA